jgi:hypothetical protein
MSQYHCLHVCCASEKSLEKTVLNWLTNISVAVDPQGNLSNVESGTERLGSL